MPRGVPGHPECSIEGCGRPHVARGLCGAHRARQKRGADMFAPVQSRNWRRGTGLRLTKDGYVHVRVDGRYRPQHRLVMEQRLGRPLLPGENVHHINGVRTDNRPENLELWVSTQPSGQRASDLLAWAHQIIERYGDAA